HDPAAEPRGTAVEAGDHEATGLRAGMAAAAQEGLPGGLRQRMEGAFGADFASVKVQPESAAAEAAGSRATAQGEQLDFAPGEYDPESAEGQELVAHELAHVVQQRAGAAGPAHKKLQGSNEAAEVEADAAAASAVAGERAQVRSAAP